MTVIPTNTGNTSNFSINACTNGLNLFAPNVEIAITPIKSERYFFGAYLLTNALRSGEKHISPIVITVTNRNGQKTLAFTEASAPTALTAATDFATVVVYSITAGMISFLTISIMVLASILIALE